MTETVPRPIASHLKRHVSAALWLLGANFREIVRGDGGRPGRPGHRTVGQSDGGGGGGWPSRADGADLSSIHNGSQLRPLTPRRARDPPAANYWLPNACRCSEDGTVARRTLQFAAGS